MANIGNIVNFFVTWFDASNLYNTSSDITEEVLGISFTDTGSGQVNECVLKLSGAFGNFITTEGTQNVVEPFDRFQVECEDLAGNSYNRFFEFNPLIIPSQTKTEGTLLELNLIGTEYHTQRINFAGRFFFSDAFRVAREIGVSYNDNKITTGQPVLTGHDVGYSQIDGTGNGFPKFTVNHYEYGLVEDTGYNRWQQMLDKLGGSVANGGVLDYFDCGFETSSVNAIEIAIFSQGSRTVDIDNDAMIPTITQSLEVNIGSTDVGIAAPTATQVAAWGSQTHGSLPTGHSKYASGVDQFIFRPLWDNQIAYLEDSLVKFNNLGAAVRHYKAINDIPGAPPFTNPEDDPTNWEQIDMSDEFGDTIQYSEWTDDKVKEWANCGANANAVNQTSQTITSTGATMFDINIVVLDNTVEAKFFRTWVDFRLNDAAGLTIGLFADRYAYSGQDNQFPVGRRMFVDGFVSDFAGNDSNGIPFENNISEWNGEEWLVKYRPANTGTDLSNMQAVVIDGTGNGFPKFTVNHYEYGLVEDTGYNRWQQMLDKLGGSVANGGVLDYFDCGFETSSVNAIEIAIFSQGSRTVDIDNDAMIPTITQSLEVNIGSTDVGIAAPTATQVAAWGSQTHGSLPTGHSKYASGVDQFIFRPLWDNQIAYLEDSLVKFNNLGAAVRHYKAINDIPGAPPFTNPEDDPTNWEQIDMSDEFGDTIQYSEWTDDKVKEWANCGANANAVNQTSQTITSTGATMFDINIVVLDNTVEAKFFRTWVDFRLNDAAGLTIGLFADRYAYSGQDNQFPVGRRMFVDGFVSDFAGNDSNGIPFENNISEWNGEEWLVKYRPANTGTDLSNMQAVVIDESNIYQFDQTASQWNIVTGDLAVDCLHQFSTIEAAESFDPKPTETDFVNHPDVTKDGNTFATNINSAISFTYTIGQNFNDRVTGGSATPLGDFYKKGAWAVFRIPFSPSNYGAPSVTVGNIFGTDTPSVGEDNLQPSFLDTQNMTWTSRGTRGFNQTESEDLGQTQELAAIIKITNQTVGNAKLDGITTIRVWMLDRYDNTVFYDVEIPFVDVFFPIKIPFSSFKIYRGKKPRFFDLTGNNIASLLLPQELEIVNRFAFREIQIVGFQIQDFYDEFGRYAPDITGDADDFDIDNTSLAKVFGGTLAITIDDFHLTKPLLAIARQPNVDRNLEAQFRKRPHIMTFKQLLNDAQTELEKEQFQLKQYQIETAGSELFALKFGDSFFFENDKLVNNQDDTTNPNAKKIKLVAKHIQYNLTAPGTGEGGFSRTLTSVKRFL